MPFYKAKNYEIAFLSKKRLLVKKGQGKLLSQAGPNITTLNANLQVWNSLIAIINY